MSGTDIVPQMNPAPGSFVMPAGRRLSRVDSKTIRQSFQSDKQAVSTAEVEQILRNLDRKDNKIKYNRRMRMALIGAIGFMAVMVGAMFAVTFGANEATKEAHVASNALVGLGSKSKDIIQTADVKVDLPLLAAPVLPSDFKLDSLTVSYIAEVNKISSTNADFQTVQETFKVGGIQRFNNTFITISASANEGHGIAEVRVWNGNAEVVLKDGSTQPTCHGQTSCASLKVVGTAETHALEEQALDALQVAEFITKEERALYYEDKKAPEPRKRILSAVGKQMRGRKLFVNYGCCSTNFFFLTGLARDSADCHINPHLHNGKGPSSSCAGHDSCLHACGDDCNCWGDCDYALYQSVRKSSCRWWDCVCKTARFVIGQVMKRKPNKC